MLDFPSKRFTASTKSNLNLFQFESMLAVNLFKPIEKNTDNSQWRLSDRADEPSSQRLSLNRSFLLELISTECVLAHNQWTDTTRSPKPSSDTALPGLTPERLVPSLNSGWHNCKFTSSNLRPIIQGWVLENQSSIGFRSPADVLDLIRQPPCP